MRLAVPVFNPNAQHIAARPLVLAGQTLKPGEPVPAEIGARRLRQLFDGRRIAAVTDVQPKGKAKRK